MSRRAKSSKAKAHPSSKKAKDRVKRRTDDDTVALKLEKRPPRNAGVEEPLAQTPCWMVQTNGGGSFERVERHDFYRARNVGLPGFVGRRDNPAPAKPVAQSGLASGLSAIVDTTKIPFRSIAMLTIQYENGQTAQGTAFFISRRTLATAGHNIFSAEGVPASCIEISPARNEYGDQFGPYDASLARVSKKWRASRNEGDDYGVLQIGDDLGADRLGWFGMSRYPDTASSALPINICGYPLGMAYTTQYFQSGRIQAWAPQEIEYTLTPVAGMSGAPVYRYDEADGTRSAVAIHTYGGAATNKGRRIDGELYAFLSDYL